MGGVFQEIKAELDITCLPKNMPDNLEIDISELDVGDAIRVSDLNFENITINADENALICSVVVPRKIEEEEPVEGEEELLEEEEAAEPEVISAKKKDEDEESEEG
jgi:large subunit ribosomal protein L25